ncbi:hypothetical protein ACP4OV_000931 [Aristida adscensionis]
MLRLRSHLLSAARAASLHCRRLLHHDPAAAAAPAAQFVVEDYLVSSCGLTPAQARKASKHLSHLKSPEKPEAVRAFFAGSGISKADAAAAIAVFPLILCSRVDKTLTPRIAQLRDMGMSPSQISQAIATIPRMLISPQMMSRLEFYLSLLGSYDKVHTAMKRCNFYLVTVDLERVVKPNMAFLRQCGLDNCDFVKIFTLAPRLLLLPTERLKEIVACADMLCVPRNSPTFRYALVSINSIKPEKVGTRSDMLKKALGCSEAELGIAVRKMPNVLNFTERRLNQSVNFLKMEVGLEPNYIVHRPALLCYSMKKRLMPRHYVLKILKAKGLVEKDPDYFSAVCYSDKKFVKKFLDPYKESVPGLADAYTSACAGQDHPEIQPP